MKPWNTLLTDRLPMRRILFIIVRMCRSQFKYNHLKNRKCFLNVLLHFWNLHQILNILKKKRSSELLCFQSYRLRNTSLDQCLKSAFPEHLLKVNMLKGPKHLWNLHGRFIVFFHHSSGNWLAKCLSDWCVKRCGALLTDWFLMAII